MNNSDHKCVVIQQPRYMPWLKYLQKIAVSDVFVVLDDVQYDKRGFQNRNMIRTSNGTMWLTVPVKTKGKFSQKISDVEISDDSDWMKGHLGSIYRNYAKSKYFREVFPLVEKILQKKWKKLIDLDLEFIRLFMKIFDIDKEIYMSSEISAEGNKTDKLVNLCDRLGASVYLSGTGAKDYIEKEKFENKGIKVEFQNYEPPVYGQMFEGFVPGLSSLDYLFNEGTSFPYERG